MDNEESPRHFANGDALRQAAENQFGRSLSSKEWVAVDPDGWSGHPSVAYSEADLEDLLQGMAQLPKPADRPTLSPQRAQALAHRQRTAVEAKDFVEAKRVRLFGAPRPPFENDAAAAAKWIEEQAEPAARKIVFKLGVVMPADLDDLEQLAWLRDWLTEVLPIAPLDNPDDRKAAFGSFLRAKTSPLRYIRREAGVLDYLGIVAPDEFVLKRVVVDDGTALGDLLGAAESIAKATGWSQLAAVHHILTGGVMSSPVSAHAHDRWGRESFGGPVINIEVLDPFGVSPEEVANAYGEARENIFRPGRAPRRRARFSPKHERVASLVHETPEMTWSQRWAAWNERYPDQRFVTAEAMRRAHGRARRP